MLTDVGTRNKSTIVSTIDQNSHLHAIHSGILYWNKCNTST